MSSKKPNAYPPPAPPGPKDRARPPASTQLPESRSTRPDAKPIAGTCIGRAPLQDRLFSVPEAAKLLGISDKSIRRAVYRGDLVAHRIGRLLRISATDLTAFVSQRRM